VTGLTAGGPGMGTESMIERLTVRTVPVPDPGDLFGVLPGSAIVKASAPVTTAPLAAWVRHGAGLVAWGEAAQVTLPAGADRFAAAEKWLREVFDGAQVRDEVAALGTGPIAFGSFTFDDCSDGSVLTVPRAVLGRDGHGRAWLTTIRRPGADDTAGDDTAGDDSAGGNTAGQALTRVPPGDPGHVTWQDGALPASEWAEAVAAAVARIARGDLRKVVLARDIYATTEHQIDVRTILGRLAGRYPDCYTFACGGLVGATPELLIRREGDEVRSLVLAGTMPRGVTPEEDARLAAALLSSAKEVEEHDYAAASVRRVLAPLCETLDASSPGPELLTLPNVYHLGTRVVGRLAAERSALALAAALHPTAAVGGDPTDVAVELIRELEGMDRARYAGPVGWMDACGNGEWGIALRCAQLDPADGRRARLVAGCGIVAGSVPAAEVAETLAKFRPMRTALDQAL
jgi:menaquinone-specific isochorismate synthase